MQLSRSTMTVGILGTMALAVALLPDFRGAVVRAEDPPPSEPPPTPSGTSGVNDPVLYLFVVNTQERKILVYRLEDPNGGHILFSSYRDYSYDLVLDEWPLPKGKRTSPSAEDIRDMIDDSEDYKKEKKDGKVKNVDEWVKGRLKPSLGQTSLITSGTQASSSSSEILEGSLFKSGFLYLVDKINKKILVYQISGNKLRFIAARKWEYDQKLEHSKDLSGFVSYAQVKQEALKQQKRKDEEAKAKQ